MHEPTSPSPLPPAERLRSALAALLEGLPPKRAAAAVERLIAEYRGGRPAHEAVLRDRADVVAYAAYRMPATFAADAAALGALAARLPRGWVPASHLDLGGGTGAAVWAASAVLGEEERETTVLDRAEPALALGRELASHSGPEPVRTARWEARRFTGGADLPEAGLVTVSYVLNELPEDVRRALVDAAARAAREAVVLVEPGTPAGYGRILEARDQLIAAGLTVLAPCPHDAACPIAPGRDWCHFSARVARSSLHRQVKGGQLPYEDEKFSYVAAVRPELAAQAGEPEPRIVRHPQLRKGQVLLDLCTPGDGLTRTVVTKRHGEDYRAARDAEWGDRWA